MTDPTSADQNPATPAAAASAAPATVAPVEPLPATSAPAAVATAPAGWYPVSAGSSQLRYWDGSAWTQHFHDAAAASATAAGGYAQAATPVAVVPRVIPKAPEGTSPNTIWGWLTAVSPVLSIVALVPTSFYFNTLTSSNLSDFVASEHAAITSPAYAISLLLDFVTVVAYILFPILDWHTLGKRGVPQPFHWAWSLFALIVSSPAVYMIGRTVVVRRRTGKGLAPLWVFIVVQVAAWVVGIIVVVIFLSQLFAQFGALGA